MDVVTAFLAGKMELMPWKSTSPSPDENLLAGSSKSGSVGIFRAPAVSCNGSGQL
jgi:hypothetical protein